MAKFLLYLLLLLGTNNVQANCYAGAWSNGQPVYGSLFVDGGTTLSQCQALACQIYPNIQGCPQATPTCTTTFIEKTESCQQNYSGQRRSKQETQTCSNGQTTVYPWQVFSDTCIPNPPSCQTQNQIQTLSCQTNYTGSIIQSRSSFCPDPYGQPVFGSWVTTANTCVKSLTNPTNIASPVSPVSPANPTFSTSVPTTQSAPVTVATPPSVPTSQPTTTQNTTETKTETKTETPKTSALGKMNSSVNIVLTQELIIKPNIVQYNAFPTENISQELPSYVKMHDSILMELLGLPLPNQDGQFKGMIKNTLEIEQ
jgi:hypothetical protein